jgi:hypothetical protein
LDILLRGFLCIALNRFEEARDAFAVIDLSSNLQVNEIFLKNLKIFLSWKYRSNLYRFICKYRPFEISSIVYHLIKTERASSEVLEDLFSNIRTYFDEDNSDQGNFILYMLFSSGAKAYFERIRNSTKLSDLSLSAFFSRLKQHLLMFYLREIEVLERKDQTYPISFSDITSFRFKWLELLTPDENQCSGKIRQILLILQDLFCAPFYTQSPQVSARVSRLSETNSTLFQSLLVLDYIERKQFVEAAVCAGEISPSATLEICASQFPRFELDNPSSQEIWKNLLLSTYSSPLKFNAALSSLQSQFDISQPIEPIIQIIKETLQISSPSHPLISEFTSSINQQLKISNNRKELHLLSDLLYEMDNEQITVRAQVRTQ